MAADLEDRSRLAANTQFIARVTGAILVTANTVGAEATGTNTQRADKRTRLIHSILLDPTTVGTQFARAAAGNTGIANSFADAAGADDNVKQLAVTDAAIQSFVASAWDVIAGVQPWERGV